MFAVNVGDTVRLLTDTGGLASGTVGVIFGFYRIEGPEDSVAISVGEQTVVVRKSELELVESRSSD